MRNMVYLSKQRTDYLSVFRSAVSRAEFKSLSLLFTAVIHTSAGPLVASSEAQPGKDQLPDSGVGCKAQSQCLSGCWLELVLSDLSQGLLQHSCFVSLMPTRERSLPASQT